MKIKKILKKLFNPNNPCPKAPLVVLGTHNRGLCKECLKHELPKTVALFVLVYGVISIVVLIAVFA